MQTSTDTNTAHLYTNPAPIAPKRRTERRLLQVGLIVAGLGLAAGGLTVRSLPALGLGAAQCVGASLAENGGFEEPAIDGTDFAVFDAAGVAGWDTDAEDQLIEFWSDGFTGVNATEGLQFAEVVATGPAAISQTFSTEPGTTISWSFDHQGRVGEDQLIVSLSGPDGSGASEPVTVSASPGSWTTQTGTYDVPAGQTSTVFTLKSGETAGEPGSGNLVDNVALSVVTDCPTDLNPADDTIKTADSLPTELDLGANDKLPSDEVVVYSAASDVTTLASLVEIEPDGMMYITPSETAVIEDLTYQVCLQDQPDVCATANATIEVFDENDAPIVERDHFTDIIPGQTMGLPVLDNDSDRDGELVPGSLSIATSPVYGTAIAAGGRVVYTASEAFPYDNDVLTYQICDNGDPAACSTAELEIELVPTPPTPEQLADPDFVYSP